VEGKGEIQQHLDELGNYGVPPKIGRVARYNPAGTDRRVISANW
jgi:hypothetical protein